MTDNITPTDIPDAVCRQMEAVRETGAVNMAHRSGVRKTAHQLGFNELVNWLDEHTSRNDMGPYATLLETFPDRITA